MIDRLSIARRCVEQASALALEHFNNRHTLDIATKSLRTWCPRQTSRSSI